MAALYVFCAQQGVWVTNVNEENAKLDIELKAKFYFMWFKTDNTIYKCINVIFCLISIASIRY